MVWFYEDYLIKWNENQVNQIEKIMYNLESIKYLNNKKHFTFM